MKARTFDQVSVERMRAEPTPETDACLSATRGQSLEGLCRQLERSAAQYKSDLWRERTEHGWTKKTLAAVTAERNQLRRALAQVAEDCTAWLHHESAEPSVEFIKAVRTYAHEQSQAPLSSVS